MKLTKDYHDAIARAPVGGRDCAETRLAWLQAARCVMGNIGVPELMIVLMIGAVWIVPVAAAVWALVTLSRLQQAQRATDAKLDTIVRLLQRS